VWYAQVCVSPKASPAGAGVHAKGFQFFFPSSMGDRAAGSRTTVKNSSASKVSLSKEILKILLISVAVYWMVCIYICVYIYIKNHQNKHALQWFKYKLRLLSPFFFNGDCLEFCIN
jgi:hypothetical protein